MNWLIGRRVPRLLGIVVHFAAFLAVLGIVPWALSLLGTRHGWATGLPGPSNLAGLIPAGAGFYTYFRCMREHFRAAPKGWLLEKTSHYPTPSYLLIEGPYRFSCHPIYLAEAAIWLGWIVFYGSFIVGGVVAIAMMLGPFIVPREERGLEARFEDAYREYRRTTPHWFGKVRRAAHR